MNNDDAIRWIEKHQAQLCFFPKNPATGLGPRWMVYAPEKLAHRDVVMGDSLVDAIREAREKWGLHE